VVAEHRVAVGEQFPGHPAEVVEAAHQAFETHLARAAGGDPDRGHAAVPEDRHHGVELVQFLAEWPAPDVLPIGLGLHAGQGLETHLGLMPNHPPIRVTQRAWLYEVAQLLIVEVRHHPGGEVPSTLRGPEHGYATRFHLAPVSSDSTLLGGHRVTLGRDSDGDQAARETRSTTRRP
jgi:hypothetical protein